MIDDHTLHQITIYSKKTGHTYNHSPFLSLMIFFVWLFSSTTRYPTISPHYFLYLFFFIPLSSLFPSRFLILSPLSTRWCRAYQLAEGRDEELCQEGLPHSSWWREKIQEVLSANKNFFSIPFTMYLCVFFVYFCCFVNVAYVAK